ncbi:MAG: MmcQ/YjbR family DNA-binding protein [Bacteroidetes bacterium]|nr:MmcQ/YjbR family DNA-binding protein [Bacteroidota bacterium]
MNIEELREYCLSKKQVTEEFPFDEDTLVFKVMGKIFLLMSLTSQPMSVNLKMDAERVPEYREKYKDVLPGYHMNKKHWNTVIFDGLSIPKRELLWMVDHSYDEVVKGLTRKLKDELNNLK